MSDHMEHIGEMYAVNIPELDNWTKLSDSDGRHMATKYRWIHANASLKTLFEAKEQATRLSNAVGSPMILVYMSRHILDGSRNEYPGRFHASLSMLIESALEDGRELLVSARSYGTHQALRAIRNYDTPLICLIGIAPAFGGFGNLWSANVHQYIEDVRHTRCKYLMIASELDIVTWKPGGAAYKRRLIGYRGHNEVGRAMDDNPDNVHTIAIHGAGHSPVDKYIRHGLVAAMQEGVEYFGYGGTPVADIVYGRPIPEPVIEVKATEPIGSTVEARQQTGSTPQRPHGRRQAPPQSDSRAARQPPPQTSETGEERPSPPLLRTPPEFDDRRSPLPPTEGGRRPPPPPTQARGTHRPPSPPPPEPEEG